jgi:4-hydroxybenzoate polyprenyltransferase
MPSLSRFASLVKFEHTIFALPFAYAGTLLAMNAGTLGDEPVHVDWLTFLFITTAMVGARTLAMGLNRLIDAEIDARNPRTASREIPSGLVSRRAAWGLCAVSLVVLVASTFGLDPITRVLWPIPVALFILYPYTKRFTWLCHLVLGLCTGLAPLGAWLAVTGEVGKVGVLLTVAAACWIGGFDIIYACSDVDFDRANGLKSLPASFGIARALLVTRAAHAITAIALVAVAEASGMGVAYSVGVLVVIALLVYENAIVHADDLSRVNAAFFTTNGIIGMVFLASVLLGVATA